MTISPEIIHASHAAEKSHVARMEDTRGLQVKPWLDGASLNVDRAKVEIAVFYGILDCLPLGPGALILDVGAGPCWISEWLQKLHYRTISVDIAQEMLAIGKTRLAPGSWLCSGDMAALPLADRSVDAVVCYGALHHVPNWQQALAELYRVLRPNGVLVLQEPGKGHSEQAESMAQMAQFGVLEQSLPPRTLIKACRGAGFAKAVVRPIAEVGFGPARILPAYPFFRNAPFIYLHQRWRRFAAEVVERCLNLVTQIHLVVAVKGAAYFDSRRPNIMVAR
ncbi:MAG: class I SAM-dependent methyltransferase, partial [Desulfobacterales bacterium]